MSAYESLTLVKTTPLKDGVLALITTETSYGFSKRSTYSYFNHNAVFLPDESVLNDIIAGHKDLRGFLLMRVQTVSVPDGVALDGFTLCFDLVAKALASIGGPTQDFIDNKRKEHKGFGLIHISEVIVPYNDGRNYYTEAMEKLNNIVYSEKDDIVKALAIIALQGIGSLSSEEAIEIAENHLVLTKDFNFSDQEDASLFLEPANMMFGKEEANFNRHFRVTVGSYKLFKDKDFRDFSLRAYIAYTSEDNALLETTALKDIPVDYSKFVAPERRAYSFRFLNLPLKTKKYRDYLLDQTASDFTFLVKSNELPRNASAASAIDLSEKELAKRHTDSLSLYREAVATVLPSVCEHDHAFLATARVLNSKQDEPDTLKLMIDCFKDKTFEGKQPYLVPLKKIHAVGRDSYLWIKQQSFSDAVISDLTKLLSAEEVMELIIGVGTFEPLSHAQWKKYIKNLDTYKDVPIEWWMPLVTGK